MEDIIIRIDNAAVQLKDFSIKPSYLEIKRGYIIGIKGDNGAGKTTFLKMLSGEFLNMDGKVYIDNLDVVRNKTEAMKRLGIVTGERTFFMEEDAADNEEHYALLYPDWDTEAYHNMLKMMKLPVSKKLGEYSTGEYIKYQLAFAFAYHPKVLLLDEPTANLDSVYREDFLKLLQEFVAEYETTILMSTHLQEDIMKVADYIIEIHQGSYEMREVGV